MSESNQVRSEVKGAVPEKLVDYAKVYAAGNIVLFDDLGILTNGKKRARMTRSAFKESSEILYASATSVAPIQIASKHCLEGVPNYLKRHDCGVTKKKNNAVFEPYIVSKGKGKFAYVTPEQEITFKDCFIRMKRCKVPSSTHITSTSDEAIEVQDKKSPKVKRPRKNVRQTSILQFFFKHKMQDGEPEQINEGNVKADTRPNIKISVHISPTTTVIKSVKVPSPPPLNPVLDGTNMSIQHATLRRRKYSQIFDCDDTSDLENFEVFPKTAKNKFQIYFHHIIEEQRGAKSEAMIQKPTTEQKTRLGNDNARDEDAEQTQSPQLEKDVEECHELPSDLLDDIFSLEDNFESMKPFQNEPFSPNNLFSAFPSNASFSSIASFDGLEEVQDMLKDINDNDLKEIGFVCMDADAT